MTSTLFDMCVMNDIEPFHLVGDVIDRARELGVYAVYAKQSIRDQLIEHKQYMLRCGDDVPAVRNWSWVPGTTASHADSTEADNA